MEELQIIQTTDGRQFKPWATKDDLQDPASITALASEMAQAKATIAGAINTKGGNSSESESFNELAEDIENLNDSFITYGVEVNSKIHWLKFICSSSGANRVYLTAINDDTITEISQPGAFASCGALQSVTMNALTTISGGAVFSDCTALQSITMNALTTISGGNAFQDCSSLTSVTLPNLVTISGGNAFQYCTALTSVTLPNLATISAAGAFGRCSYLTSITMTNLVTISASYVFEYTALQSVTLPILVNVSGSYIFQGCSALQSVEFGTLITLVDPFRDAKPNLRNITIGQDTNVNLPFQMWTATNVIAEVGGIDELNANLQTNLIAKLYQGGNKVLRLGAALYDVTTQETRDAVTAKGWTLQRG